MPITPEEAAKPTPEDLELIKLVSTQIDRDIRAKWEKGAISIWLDEDRRLRRLKRKVVQEKLKKEYADAGWTLTFKNNPSTANQRWHLSVRPKPKPRVKKTAEEKAVEAAIKDAPDAPSVRMESFEEGVARRAKEVNVTNQQDLLIAEEWARVGDRAHARLAAHRASIAPTLSVADESYYEGIVLAAEGVIESFFEMAAQVKDGTAKHGSWGIGVLPILVREPSQPGALMNIRKEDESKSNPPPHFEEMVKKADPDDLRRIYEDDDLNEW